MKKQNLFNILIGTLLSIGILFSSCNNEDLQVNKKNGSHTVTFNMFQTFNGEYGEVEGRNYLEKPDTIYKKFSDGMEIKAIIEPSYNIKSRINYIATQMIYGIKVLAIFVDIATNKIYKIDELTTTNLLICEIPDFPVRIIFYSYNSSSLIPETNLKVGDVITSDSRYEYYGDNKSIMWFEIPYISPNDIDLGKIEFKTLTSRFVVKMYDITESYSIYSFKTTLENCSAQRSFVDPIGGTIQTDNDLITFPIELETTYYPEQELRPYKYTSPKDVFPTQDTELMKLNIIDINGIPINRSFTFNKKTMPGYEYSIKVYVKRADT